MSFRELISSLALAGVALGATIAMRIAVVDPQAETRHNRPLPKAALESPGPEILHLVSFEQRHGVADLVWLGIVEELGSSPKEHQVASWDWIEREARIGTDLDPKYFIIYYASAVQLTAWAQDADRSDSIASRGKAALPLRWEFPFLLGYNAYFLRKNGILASDHWNDAVLLPDAPRFMPSLAARARFHGDDELGAIQMLEEMLTFLQDGPQREDAETRLQLLKSEFRERSYDEACKKFLADKGRRPQDGKELYEAGYTKEPPVDYLDNPISIDENCIARTPLTQVREHEAMKRDFSVSSSTTSHALQALGIGND